MKVRWLADILPSLSAFIKARWPFIFFPLLVISFVYWLLSAGQREWVRDRLVPVTFFLALAARTLWRSLGTILNKQAKLSLIILLSINNTLILSFMSLTIFSYILRSRPMHQAAGIKERAFPLFVVFFHLIGSYFIATRTRFHFNLTLYIVGLILSILGATIDCLAIWKLKRSFSIMVEVRPLVTSGIYGIIRHPLYSGELIHFLGIAMLFNNKEAYGMFVILIFMQTMRALLEEKKMIAHIPEYSTYREKTGFFLPRFRHTKGMSRK